MARKRKSGGKRKSKGRYPGVKSSDFVYPKQRKYPINTISRARAALRYAGQKRTFGSYSTVAKKVRAKYGKRVGSVSKGKK